MFTRDQIEEIKKKLIMLGTKDTQFPDAYKLNGEEIVAIVQDGENRKIPLSSIINDDFINVSKDTTEILTLSTAVSKIDINNRKLGQVITFKDSANSWAIRQFTGSSLDNWNDISLWKSISGIDELKSQADTNTSNISSLNTEVSVMQSKVDENTTSISQINNNIADNNKSIAQINTTLDEHTESINARITTDRIADGAVTSEKIATSAFDSTLSLSGKIAPADVVGERLTELGKRTSSIADYTITPSKNIFNNNTILGYIRSSDYGFNIDSSGKYIATIPIEVKSNCIYYIKRNSVSVTASTYLRCLVNADDEIGKSPLNYINGNALGASVEDKSFRIPSDCHYVQAQLVFGEVPTTDDYKKVMIEEIGETYPSSFSPSPYEPYGDNYSSKVKDEAMPESFNNLQDRVKALETADIEVVQVPIQDSGRNVYLNASGSIISSASGATICYFDVEDGIEYTLKVPKTGNTASIVWAYSNGDTSTATPPEVPIVGNSEPFEGTIKVNSNLGKIVVCYHKAEGQPTLEYIKKKEDATKKTLKIICFGNSFTQDSMMYVPAILKKICPDLELTIGVCVIGSCSLSRHLVNITNTASDAWTPTNYDYEYSKNGSAWANKSLSGEECLQEEVWDVITFQQNGENAGRPVSAWEDNIGKSIRPLQKALYTKLGRTVKLGFILTHGSYDTNTDNLKIRWQNTALNVKKVEEETAFVEIFPYGTAIQNLRTTSLVNLGYGSAKNLLADSAHLQDGIACLCACYTNALKIMQLAGIDKSVFGDDTLINMDFITSNNILGTNPNSLTQDDIIGMSDGNRYLAQLSAIQAMRNPWAITDISAFE